MRLLATIVLLVTCAGAGGCASLKNDQTVCPEYRNLRCATEETCTTDAQRGCRVCACAPPAEPGATPPGIAPGDPTPR